MLLDIITWGMMVHFTICTNTSQHNNWSKDLRKTTTINCIQRSNYDINQPRKYNPSFKLSYQRCIVRYCAANWSVVLWLNIRRKINYCLDVYMFFCNTNKTCTLNIMMNKKNKNIYNVSQLGMLAVASFTIFTRVTWKHYNKQIKG
jgi:hypothetical protein